MASLRGGGGVAGRVDLEKGGISWFDKDDIDENTASVAVDDGGEVSVIGNGFVTRWDGENQRRFEPGDALVAHESGDSAPSDADGKAALSSYFAGQLAVLDGDHVRQVYLGLPEDTTWEVVALGWVGGRVLLETYTGDDSTPTIRLLPLSGGPGQEVGTAEVYAEQSLTVAYQLVDADRPTVERPEPDWPWSEERWSITIGLGVAAVLSGLWLLRWARRHYRAAR
jgi:hypothetical protein